VNVSDVVTFDQSGGACLTSSCSTSSAITVDQLGQATLHGQSAELTSLTVEAQAIPGRCQSPSSPQTKVVVANIDADTFDVDLGNPEEVVFPRLHVGQQWELPVYADTGDELLTAFDVTIQMSSTHFSLGTCTSFETMDCGDDYADACWPGYEFFCNELPLRNGVRMIGQKADNAHIRGRIRLATVSVTATADSWGPLEVTGLINVLTVAGELDPVASGQAVFAGRGQVFVGSSRRMDSTSPQEDQLPRLSTRRLAAECSSLTGLEIADTNADGKLNVLDSALLLEKYIFGSHESCKCDPSMNGITDLNDFNLLSLATVTGLLLMDQGSLFAEVE
jgi:hypothetical protein